MKITNTTRYPHPVIDEFTNDFTAAKFECQLTLGEEVDAVNRTLELAYAVHLQHPELERLLEKNNAVVSLMIECGDTYFRRLKHLQSHIGSLTIEADCLYGTVLITPIIYPQSDIVGYSPSGVHEEFGSSNFQIASGYALAVAPTQKFSLLHDNENHLESVFNFITQEKWDDFEFGLNIDNESIDVLLNTDTRRAVDDFRTSAENKAILLNSLYFPILVSVVSEMVNDLKLDQPELTEKRWFMAIQEVGEREDFEITANSNPFEIAQMVLRKPFKALASSNTGMEG